MLSDANIGFIGSGVMAQAMIAGLLREHLVSADRVTASGPRSERGQELAEEYGIHSTTNNVEAAQGRDIVVLSIKPQLLDEILVELRGHIDPDALVVSIIAGASTQRIVPGLKHKAVVRVMPNTPARISKGMSVWMATEDATPAQREQARTILGALGEEHEVDHEYFLDMATALSGTGPAYVFLFMEAMIDAGVHLGLSRRVSEQLVLQTMEGSIAFARRNRHHPAELRNMVTSPGGTTAEALYQLEKGGFRTVLSKAIWAAYQKSRYLGGLSS
jgi:pyrroline-5-carboxylate reductase